MKIKEIVYEEINDLSPSEFASIYQYIHAIKSNRPKQKKVTHKHWYHEVSEVLEDIAGNLEQDISEGREDRI